MTNRGKPLQGCILHDNEIYGNYLLFSTLFGGKLL